MGYKLGFLLSLFFVIQIMAYAGDLCAVQSISSLLDATALTAAQKISLERGLKDDVVAFVREQANATIVKVSSNPEGEGEVFVFKIYRNYQPLIISDSAMVVSVTRSTVLGY